MIRRAALVGAVLAVLGLSWCAAPAGAQVVPPPPPQAAPVFEVVAPIASPACGNALLVAVLAPGIVNGETSGALPLDAVTPVFGPLFEVCGAVPAPPARLTCRVDTKLNNGANAIAAAIAGTQLPVGLDPFGNAVEETIVLQDTLPAPANTTGLAQQVAGTLDCTAPASVATPPETPAPAPSDEPFDSSVLGGDEFALAPLLGTLAPGITSTVAPRSAPALRAAPAGAVAGGVGFAYPVVFALPLVLLVIGGYLGRSLTQPVAPPHR